MPGERFLEQVGTLLEELDRPVRGEELHAHALARVSHASRNRLSIDQALRRK